MVRAGDLNAEDLGSNPQLGLLNGFVLGDPRGKFTTLYSQLVCLLPVGILNWERGEGDFNMILKSPFWGVIIKYLYFLLLLIYIKCTVVYLDYTCSSNTFKMTVLSKVEYLSWALHLD